ncbi:MAG: YigZ family protein [Candidatus Phytoplasma sp.]|nr:YigZ family protein [Phytoplasma sp.]
MIYLKEQIVYEIVIQKSRFIAVLTPIEDLSELDAIMLKLKKDYPKANHYCSAYVYGTKGEYASANDDGEPSRTAGIPILEILKQKNLTNVYAVVIRYFGGIKLGAGGLIRAYAKAPLEALNEVGSFYKKVFAPVVKISFPYHLIDKMDQHFKDQVMISEKEYLNDVTYTLIFEKEENLSLLEEIKYLLSEVIYLEKTLLKMPVSI